MGRVLLLLCVCLISLVCAGCGGGGEAAGGGVTPIADTVAPTLSISAPANNATVSGLVSIAAMATDNVAVTLVEFRVDGSVIATLASAPHTMSWVSTTVADGVHVVEVRAFDGVGNQGTASVSVTVDNAVVPPPPVDTTPPVVSVTAPGQGALVSGVEQVVAVASDDVGVAQVEFRIDGVVVGTVTSPPYQYAWDTSGVGDGAYLVEVRASDATGNSASASVAVLVSNAALPDTTPPTVSFTSPAASSTLSGLVSVNVDASDNVAVDRVEFSVSGVAARTDTSAPWGLTWDTTALANGVYSISARAVDSSGNHVTAAIAVIVNNLPPPDVTPPTVAITAPTASATVSGSVAVSVSASDNVGVASVAVRINGVLVATLTAAPYSYTWDTTGLANGSHTILVTASDAASNTETDTVSVTVSSVVPPASNRVVMAYAENVWGAGGAAAVSAFDYSAVTHVIHGFVLPEANGSLTQHINFENFRTGDGWMPQTLPAAVHTAGKKIIMSIGGALPATNATNFATIAASPSLRQTFITNVVSAIATWGYDGVDIDYEWPNSIVEGQQFTVLMQELYTAVKLANASSLVVFGAGPGDKVGYKEWAQLAQWCDYCFFFGYDWHWGFPAPAPIGPITNPGTTFVASSGPSFERSVRGAVNYVLGQGFPAGKLVIGIPFYSDNGTTWSNGGRADWQALTPAQRQNVHADYREVLINGKYWTTPEAIPLKLDALLKVSTSVLRDGANNPVAAAGVGWWEWGHENPSHGELTAAVKAWMIANP